MRASAYAGPLPAQGTLVTAEQSQAGLNEDRCPVCQSTREKQFTALVLERYSADYYFCSRCGLMQAANPHWLSEAYQRPIALADTGILLRNESAARRLTTLLYSMFGDTGSFCDWGGGFGILTRMMRDRGFDYYWSDPTCANLFAETFEARLPGRYDAVSALEVMEHIPDPKAFIQSILDDTGTDTIIFTTLLFEVEPPPRDWWYYVFGTGQHITFYQTRTLQMLADHFDMQLLSQGDLHMLTRMKVSRRRYRLLVGRAGAMASPLIRRALTSRTLSDHELIVARSVHASTLDQGDKADDDQRDSVSVPGPIKW